MDESDWRRMGQEQYLTGVTLFRRTWKQSRADWDHDHCEFCGAKFSADDAELREGWTTADECRWICDVCFADFRERFAWTEGSSPQAE